jgi:hypothetical protein
VFHIGEQVRNVRLVLPVARDYRDHLRRSREWQPTSTGCRSASEYIGDVVERAVRHWLYIEVPLRPERVLSWEERQVNGRYRTHFRELDAVRTIDRETLCLFEFKTITAKRMRRGCGLDQLNRAAETLYADRRWRRVLKRLVYVAAEPVPVLGGLTVVDPADTESEVGVVWVQPVLVEAMAGILGRELPADWLEPEVRARPLTEAFSDPFSAAPGAQESSAQEEGVLALALRRALATRNTVGTLAA